MLKMKLLVLPFCAIALAFAALNVLSMLGIAPWVTLEIMRALLAVIMLLATTILCVMAYYLTR